MYKEVNTGTNLPAQIEIYATGSRQYDFLFMAKGGGSENKTFLYQQTKTLLTPDKFIDEKIKVGDISHNCKKRKLKEMVILIRTVHSGFCCFNRYLFYLVICVIMI